MFLPLDIEKLKKLTFGIQKNEISEITKKGITQFQCTD